MTRTSEFIWRPREGNLTTMSLLSSLKIIQKTVFTLAQEASHINIKWTKLSKNKKWVAVLSSSTTMKLYSTISLRIQEMTLEISTMTAVGLTTPARITPSKISSKCLQMPILAAIIMRTLTITLPPTLRILMIATSSRTFRFMIPLWKKMRSWAR